MSPSKEERSDPPPGKIAIKGFSLSSKAGTAKPGANGKKPAPPSNLGKRSRGGFGHDSDSDDDRSKNTHEVVTGFGSEGAIARESIDAGSGRKGGELVIKKMANRDWRAEANARRRGTGKDLLPQEERAMRDGGEGKKEGVDVVNGNDGEIQWGLSVRKRAKTEEDDGIDASNGQAEREGGDDTSAPTSESLANIRELEAAQTSKPPVSADEEALASLLGTNKERKGPELTIPTPLTEQEAYKAAVASAPDPSSLEDYERVPVEEFGAALLRGMGWKGEKNVDTKKRDVKRRQNLLGLGAKELDGAEELGAWVQKSDVKRLNTGGGRGGSGGFGGGDRRPKAGDYKREKERERERREERGGGGYRREKERERERERDGGSGRDRHREYRR
ncbi:DExH-box splicing factor binding site-domain-containing protein [Cadophora sp. MPI-SDFR-AT-0126]|nr:DExH-box splicing factor binding site-domain-containing protein [Leotiomycetes sp. MPI-SDFR-AT-0126]